MRLGSRLHPAGPGENYDGADDAETAGYGFASTLPVAAAELKGNGLGTHESPEAVPKNPGSLRD